MGQSMTIGLVLLGLSQGLTEGIFKGTVVVKVRFNPSIVELVGGVAEGVESCRGAGTSVVEPGW